MEDAEFYRQAFLATDAPAIVTDENFLILDANDACLKIGSWEREELIGEMPFVLFEDPSLFENIVTALVEENHWRGDFEARTNDGRQVSGEGMVAPIYNESGDAVGYVGIFEDQTSRRKQEESLRVLNRVLRHNLRNDANVVLGHLDAAAEAVEDETVLHSLSVATRRVQSILDRAQTTREFSRLLESDDPALYPVTVDGAIRQAVNTVEAGESTISLDIPEGIFVLADETVTAALRNVIENAVVHGGDAPTIEISVKASDDRVQVHVADDGPGIEEERRDRVLERGGDDVYHSQGLGLFFVDRLMDVYGGDLSISESDLGGCLVTLSFPRTRPEQHGLG